MQGDAVMHVADDIIESWGQTHTFAVSIHFMGGPADGARFTLSSADFADGERFSLVRDRYYYRMVLPWRGEREVWLKCLGRWK